MGGSQENGNSHTYKYTKPANYAEFPKGKHNFGRKRGMTPFSKKVGY